MRVVGLVSGGKDSCYNLINVVAEGHELVALANLRYERGPHRLSARIYRSRCKIIPKGYMDHSVE